MPPEFCLRQLIDNNRQAMLSASQYFSKMSLTTSRYRHAVTQAKTSNPLPEIGGGILADEMGMGKSLSMLNLITTRLPDALKWEVDDAASLDSAFIGKSKSRASLIVVSSARKILIASRDLSLSLYFFLSILFNYFTT